MNILNTIFGISTALAQISGTKEIASETENQLTSLVSFVISQIPLWITAFIVIVLSFVVAKIVKSAVENKMAAEGFEEEHKEIQILAARTANATVLTIGITVGLKIAGIDLTAIIAAAAFGIGFALRDIIMNFIAGVLLLSSRHYTIGDVIKIKGTVGKIVEIQTRATIIKAFDGTKVIVPNAELFKNQVISFTSNPFRKIALTCGVNYGEDLKKTSKVALKAIQETKGVLIEPKPSISFTEWGTYSINFKIKAWVESRSSWIKTRSSMIINITNALKEAGITIPYPIQKVKLSKEEHELEEKAEKLVMEEETTSDEEELKELKPAPVKVAKTGSPENMAAPDWLKKASNTHAAKRSAPSGKASTESVTPPSPAEPEFVEETPEEPASTPEPQPEQPAEPEAAEQIPEEPAAAPTEPEVPAQESQPEQPVEPAPATPEAQTEPEPEQVPATVAAPAAEPAAPVTSTEPPTSTTPAPAQSQPPAAAPEAATHAPTEENPPQG